VCSSDLELEKNSRKPLETLKDDKSTHVSVENNKNKGGRPLGSCKPKVDKEKRKMLKELRKIWANEAKDNKIKGSDIVSSATLYAELMGWRLKTPQESLKGDIMSISFSRDDKQIAKPPSNKMLTGEQVENKSMPANPPTTTAQAANVSSKVVGCYNMAQ
jgi:hypothetical protein